MSDRKEQEEILNGDGECFTFKMKVDGVVKTYHLKELNGDQRDAYLNEMKKRAVVDKDGKPSGGFSNYDKMQAILLKDCIVDQDNQVMSLDWIQKRPVRILEMLFAKQQKMSGLDKDAESEAKNDKEAKDEIG